MAVHFFDIADGVAQRDDTGTECATRDDVRYAAMRTLAAVANENIPREADRQFYTVVVRDESRSPVFTATLSFTGMWLDT